MDEPTLNQDEIDALLTSVSDESAGAGEGEAAAEAAPAQEAAPEVSEEDISSLLGEEAAAPAAAPGPAPAAYAPAAPAAVDYTKIAAAGDFSQKNIEALLDVPLSVVVELGRTDMQVKDVLELGPGSVVELERLAGETIDVMVNGKLVARGEVVVVDESFGVKITHIVSPMERLSQLK
ncbi:MAG: flagellar motor switch protein FliN [bacterium]